MGRLSKNKKKLTSKGVCIYKSVVSFFGFTSVQRLLLNKASTSTVEFMFVLECNPKQT